MYVQLRSPPSPSMRTIASRTGSPTVRMIVARSRAATAGWRILSGAIGDALIAKSWYNFRSSMSLEISKRGLPSMRSSTRTLSQPLAYALAAGVIGMALFASVTPSPLYGTYAELWGFSPAVLTLVFGTYAFGVLTTLMLAGRVSDEVGRRPVLLVALSSLLVTTIVYMLAQSVVWLFAARALQGLATGLALASAAAVQYLPAPRIVPYVILFALFAIALTGALLMPEPVENRKRLRLTPQRPGVPPV